MRSVLAAAFAAVLVVCFAVPAMAIQSPQVTLIPSVISANSSFVMVVDPSASSGESVGVHWQVGGEVYVDSYFNKMGSVPKAGSKWICYFSNTDSKSTCGPTPFVASTTGYIPYEMIVYANNPDEKVTNNTLSVNVGGIILTTELDYNTDNIRMKVWPNCPVNGVEYRTYYATDLTPVPGKSGSLSYMTELAGYTGTVSLFDGEYYIAFTVNGTEGCHEGGDYGGTLVRVAQGITEEEQYTGISADEFYWSVLISSGEQKETSRFTIKNLGSDPVDNLSVRVPSDWNNKIDVSLGKDSLQPNEETYYTVTIGNIYSVVNIKTTFDVLSGQAIVKKIPATILVSIEGASGTDSYCSSQSDGTFCNGGVCCSDQCVSGGECCSNSDCRSGEACTLNRCTASGSVCSSGTCYEGTTSLDCPVSTSYKYETCTTSLGKSGVCCAAVNECDGRSNGDACTGGKCCGQTCVAGAECCSSSDCPGSQECSSDRKCVDSSTVADCGSGQACRTFCDSASGEMPTTTSCAMTDGSTGTCCYLPASSSGGVLDMNLIIMVVIAVVVIIVAFLLFKKFGKGLMSKITKKGGDDKEEGTGDEEYFEDDEFY